MKIENCAHKEKNPEKFHLAWQDFRLSPMAGNLQLIFYRNTKGEIWSQLLLNEKTGKLPKDSENTPLYRWEVVKAFWQNML